MSDVVIVGGGPAGAALGAYLSLAGIPNLILEKSIHPRPHVGESLVPSTTRIFRELGFLEVMERRKFPKKYGASWNAGTHLGTFSIEFREFTQEGVDQDYTYHVDRGEFDLELLKHAERLGSKVIEGVPVREVLFDSSGYVKGVELKVGSSVVTIDAQMVVDATGRGTLLGRQLKLKEVDPEFDQVAVHGWFTGIDRGVGSPVDHIRIYFLPVERGWAWQIPITDKITSMGVVVDKKVFKAAIGDNENHFRSLVPTNLDLKAAMRDATRINEFKVEADYSYCMKSLVGNGYVLIGDAARFVDPIFSSGVSIALTSAKFASECIRLAVETKNFGADVFRPYEQKIRRGTNVWREFIKQYYRLLPLFVYFINNKKHRLEVLRLLQGDVYERDEVPVLDAMREFIRTVEASDTHFLKNQLRRI